MIQDQRAGSLLSVNVGMPRDLLWHGKTVHTAVWKRPVEGARPVRRLNIDGDGQGDLAGHGGEHRAVFVYQIESYRYWQDQLGRDDFEYGQFGENFTVQGLADDQVCIGDRYRIGCGALRGDPAARHLLPGGHPDGRPADARAAGLPSPARVLPAGAGARAPCRPGMRSCKVASGPEGMTVAEIDALLYLPGHPRQQVQRALRIPALPAGWQELVPGDARPAGGAGRRHAATPA